MASDPRESITVAGLRVTESLVDEVWIVGDSRDEYWAEAGRADWPDLVAFARAILAADEAWEESRVPTLEELRERYPGRLFGVRKNVPCGPTFCDEAWIEGVVGTPHYSTEDYALRWLAAELAKVNGGT